MRVLERARKAFAEEVPEDSELPNDVRHTFPKYELNELDEKSFPSMESPPAVSPVWDTARASTVMADCNALIENGETAGALTPPQRIVLEMLRNMVCVHAAQHDALLWVDHDFLAAQVAGWKEINIAARALILAPSKVQFQNIPRSGHWWASGYEPGLLALVKDLFPADGAPAKVGQDTRESGPVGTQSRPEEGGNGSADTHRLFPPTAGGPYSGDRR